MLKESPFLRLVETEEGERLFHPNGIVYVKYKLIYVNNYKHSYTKPRFLSVSSKDFDYNKLREAYTLSKRFWVTIYGSKIKNIIIFTPKFYAFDSEDVELFSEEFLEAELNADTKILTIDSLD